MPMRFSKPIVPFAHIDKGDGTPPRQWPRAGHQPPVGSDAPRAPQPEWPQESGHPVPRPSPQQPAPYDPQGRDPYAQQRDPLQGFPIPHRTWTTKGGTQVTVAGCCLPLPLGLLLSVGAVAALKINRMRSAG